MPQMGVSVAEGTILAWTKQVGEEVRIEETVCEVSTDKIEVEIPAPANGTLAEILVNTGETVDVGTVLARVATSGSPVAPEATAATSGGRAEDPEPRTTPSSAGPAGARLSASGVKPRRNGAGPRYSPVVRRIAASHGIDLTLISGTGRDGRVTKQDALAYVETAKQSTVASPERPLHSESPYRPDAEPAPAATGVNDLGGRPEPLSRMRRSIGAAMHRSLQTAASCTTIVECDVSRIERRRRELDVTALPLIARATILTLRDFPDLNATLEGETITRYERVHLGIAVSLGDDGLLVPVIHDAQELAVEGLAGRIKELASRARSKRLTPDDVYGATFTITNPGAFGALIATPVIDLPQVAILDIETISRRPVVVIDADGGEAITIRSMVNLCMSWDHRAIDGAYAARFLTALRRRIEDDPA